MSQNNLVVTGWKKELVVCRIWISTFFSVLLKYPNPAHIFKILRRMKVLKNRFTVDRPLQKLSKVDGRYFFNINNNGWPASYFHRMVHLEADGLLKGNVQPLQNLRMVLIGFTKKCPLNCEHCYEGEELNKKETLTLSDHKKILSKFQDLGISQFQFGGGEPMVRLDDFIELLNSAKKTADFWISTSGFKLNADNAKRLKNAGLTGVALSLDHFDATQHNLFRRHKDAFSWAENAARSAVNARLVLALSICVTRAFCTEENLFAYIKLAKKWGASFVQLLEPRSVGNYAGKDVALSSAQEGLLTNFYFKMNNDKTYRDMPIVIYHGYRQRLIGCAGAGSRYLYIDTDGFMNRCPFCRNNSTHVLGEDAAASVVALKAQGCSKFETIN